MKNDHDDNKHVGTVLDTPWTSPVPGENELTNPN